MTVAFTWSVSPHGLQTRTENGNPDTVVGVHFNITATNGTHTIRTGQSIQLQPSTDGTFTPFNNLTEAQVIEWVKAALPAGQQARIEAALTNMLQAKANAPVPAVAKASPWDTCSQAQK